MNAEQTERILTETAAFWARVEILGRRTYHGRVTVETLGGASLLRVEVPALPELTKRERGYWLCEGETASSYGLAEVTYPAQAGETHFVGLGSIYEITPMPEEVLMALYGKIATRNQPTRVVRVTEARQIEGDVAESDEDEENDCCECPTAADREDGCHCDCHEDADADDGDIKF